METNNNNTKINICHSFKDTEIKLCYLKVVLPNKISLSHPQCFSERRLHPLVRALFPTNPIVEVPLAGRLFFLFKLSQTYARSKYPKYCSRIRDSLFRKNCPRKITQTSSFESKIIQACQEGTQGNVERCNIASITMWKPPSQQTLSCIKEGWRQ